MSRYSAGIASLAIAVALAVPTVAQAAPSPSELLREQVASQAMIGALLGTTSGSSNWIRSISFGRVRKPSVNKAVIDVTVRTRGGSTVPGKLVVKRYQGVWYFYSITRGTAPGGISTVVVPAGLSTSLMRTAIRQQRSHRWMLSGIVYGGYKKLTVLSRHSNWNTRQVNIRMSGGSRSSTTGRVMAYRKKASDGSRFWFISTLR